ncbi:hypothetical protein N7481_008834 [Penicillium waksmanii]|uniref:uncharacterized protein n=1 Tax=Penicillium waksmanii TaxID=69791 RepID=UPI0025473D13|nr:uncharacterized protein N7481_008834 [Penicillium waksmanii]KAJ5975127.1 hypothetical protein N7481_008834 [Penicillium waksmanii]
MEGAIPRECNLSLSSSSWDKNPIAWRKNWVKGNKSKEEISGFTDAELGIYGAESANSELYKVGEHLDEAKLRVN